MAAKIWIAVVATIFIFLLVAGLETNSSTMTISEMAAFQGGNNGYKKCSESCDHFNEYSNTCVDKAEGQYCVACEKGANVAYYVDAMGGSGCEATEKYGYKESAEKPTSNCGAKSKSAACTKNSAGVMECKAGSYNDSSSCKNRQAVIGQPEPSPKGDDTGEGQGN